jgi:hypothetical protein
MAFYKRFPGRVNRTSLVFLSLALVMLAACTHDIRVDTDIGVKQSPKPDFSPPLNGPFKKAETWIESLNQQGVPCRPYVAEHAPPPPKLVKDVGTCHLDDGDTVTVWIVGDAKQTFDSQFAETHGPRYIFYRADWLAFVPAFGRPKAVSVIRKAVTVIRESFHAQG